MPTKHTAHYIHRNSPYLKTKKLGSWLSVLLLLAGTSITTQAQTWNGGTGNWTTSSNWDTNTDPNSSTTNIFINSGDGVVNLNATEKRTIRDAMIGMGDQLNINALSTLTLAGTLWNNGTVQNQGELRAATGKTAYLDGGTVLNTGGTIIADGAGTVFSFNPGSADNYTVTGGTLAGINGGVISSQSDYITFNGVTFKGASNFASNYYANFTGTTTFDNAAMAIGNSAKMNFGNGSNQSAALAGSGTITLGSSAVIGAKYTGVTLTNGVTITGAGSIGGYTIRDLINTGSIIATGGKNLNVQLAANGTFTNQGTVRAEAGSTLYFGHSGTGNSWVNTGRTMTAEGAGAKIHFDSNGNGGTFEGGILEGKDGGTVVMQNDFITFKNVTFEGNSEAHGNYHTNFSGTTTVNGVMTSGYNSQLRFGEANNDDLVLTGTGTVELRGATVGAASASGISFTGVTLTNEVALETYQSSAHVNIGGGTLWHIINDGSITAKTGQLSLAPATGGTFTNQGIVRAEAGTTINFSTAGVTYTNTGHTISADGASAQLWFNAGSRIVGGTLEGKNGGEVFLQSDQVVFQDVTFAGNSRISGNYYPIFTGDTTISGTMLAENTAQLRFGEVDGASEALDGTGTLEMAGGIITSQYNDVDFTNATNIIGFGNLGAFKLKTITNTGTITANQSASSMSVNLAANGAFTNNGLVAARNGATFNVGNTWVRTGNFIRNTHTAPLDSAQWKGTLSGGAWEVSNGGKIDVSSTSNGQDYRIHTNDARVTLRGATSSITGFSGEVQENTGTLRILDGHQFVAGGNGSFGNTGIVEIGENSSLEADYTSGAASHTTLNGTLDGQNHSIDGLLDGSGFIKGNVAVTGVVDLGNGIGTAGLLNLSGADVSGNANYTQTAGTINFDIGRFGGGLDQDRIVTLDGNIDITSTTIYLSLLTGSQLLQVGDTFTLLQANPFDDDTASLSLFDINWDYDSSLSGYSFSYTMAADALTVRVDAIPEPGSVGLIGLGLASLIYMRRKRTDTNILS